MKEPTSPETIRFPTIPKRASGSWETPITKVFSGS